MIDAKKSIRRSLICVPLVLYLQGLMASEPPRTNPKIMLTLPSIPGIPLDIATLGMFCSIFSHSIYIATTLYQIMHQTEDQRIALIESQRKLQTIELEDKLRSCIQEHASCKAGVLGLPATCEEYAKILALQGKHDVVENIIEAYRRYFNLVSSLQ